MVFWNLVREDRSIKFHSHYQICYQFFKIVGTDSADSEEDSDSDDESSGRSEGSCSYSDSNSESDDESSGDEEGGGGSESNSDCSSEHSEQTFSIQETNFEQACGNCYIIYQAHFLSSSDKDSLCYMLLQGALKLKITMKGPKKEESEKIKSEKSRKNVPKRLKTNHGNKVIIFCKNAFC